MQQKRLILALLISTAILFLWSYLVPVKTPQQIRSPSSTVSPQETVTAPPAAENRPSPSKETSVAASSVEETPRRTLVVRTPLYQATFDSRGAGVISWIIRKNKDSGLSIYSVA